MKPSKGRSLRDRALDYLARREHSYQELYRKLLPYLGEESCPEDLTALLDEFKERGYLSDERFVEMTVHARQRKFGRRRIVHELREKGVDESLISEVLPGLKENEREVAREVWQRKFGRLPESPKERARQIAFLQYRGFSMEVIQQILRDRDG